jgi:hypothetical protein
MVARRSGAAGHQLSPLNTGIKRITEWLWCNLVGNIDSAKPHLAKLEELDPGMTVRCVAEERSSVLPEAMSLAYLRDCERM